MGQPKLLLPWGENKLIDQVLQAWTSSRVHHVVVVVRRDDVELSSACARWPVSVVHPPTDPPDMKASIQIGLRHLSDHHHPSDDDRCFVAPADLPTLSSEIIDRLIQSKSDDSTIVLPRFGGRQGHPALLPWRITSQVFQLAQHEGVDRLIARHHKTYVDFGDQQAINDIDTPEQYRKALATAKGTSSDTTAG